MKYQRVLVGVVVAVVLVVLGYTLTTSQNTQDADSPVVIGAIVGATGQYGVVGENYTKGIELAREVWLEQNPDKKVEVIIEDDGFDPKRGLAAYQKLTGVNDVDALINMTSPTIDAIYSMVTQTGMPVAQGGEQGVEPTDDTVFQLLPGNIETLVALGAFAKEKGYANVAIFYANNATYVRFVEGFKRGYGGTISEFPINMEDRDYRTHVAKALAVNPDAIVISTTPEQGAGIVRTMNQQSAQHPPLLFDANIQTGFADYKRILEDTTVLDGSYVVTIRQQSNPDFATRYKNKYGEEPGIATDWAYDSFMLLMRTYDTDQSQWVKNMKQASFEGAGGSVAFDAVGVRKPTFSIGEIQNGELPQ